MAFVSTVDLYYAYCYLYYSSSILVKLFVLFRFCYCFGFFVMGRKQTVLSTIIRFIAHSTAKSVGEQHPGITVLPQNKTFTDLQTFSSTSCFYMLLQHLYIHFFNNLITHTFCINFCIYNFLQFLHKHFCNIRNFSKQYYKDWIGPSKAQIAFFLLRNKNILYIL